MSLNEEVDLLRNIPLFAALQPAKLKLLAFTSQRLTFAVGHSLFHQGEVGDSAYIIVAGEANVIIETPSGPFKVATLGKNDFVGEIAILCNVPRTATITAASELTALRISKDLFVKLLAEFPEMAVEMLRVLAQRLEHTTSDLLETRARLEGRAP